MIAHPQLTSRDYESNYYKEHADAGLDYLIHGSWHQSYAAMVTESTFQTSYANPFVLDAGCVCGSILKGFKDLQAFSQVFGIDLSAYMVALGRKEFGFTHEELVAGSIAKIPAWPSAAAVDGVRDGAELLAPDLSALLLLAVSVGNVSNVWRMKGR